MVEKHVRNRLLRTITLICPVKLPTPKLKPARSSPIPLPTHAHLLPLSYLFDFPTTVPVNLNTIYLAVFFAVGVLFLL
jgi:hypothetical protein